MRSQDNSYKDFFEVPESVLTSDAFKDGYVINYGDFFNNKTGKFEHKFKSSEIADSMKNLHLNDFNKEIA